jgi:P pilus assembly chaperone PapD
MTKRFIARLFLLAVFLIASPQAMARNAGLLLSPTRVIFEGTDRFAAVTLRNNGDGVGRYKIELVDTIMDENGGIKVREDGAKDEFSAMDMVSLSPRSMTLKPDESQTVRILIKNKADLPDGEYRSHLQVRMTENDLDLETNKPSTEGANVVLKPKLTTVIPLIVRKGKTSYDVKIDDAMLEIGGGDGKQVPEVKVSMSFSGNRSVLGDVKVTHVAADGKETQLVFFRGVAIYRGVAKRNQRVAATVPDGVNIHSGRLRVAFLSQENEGSHVLSEKEITP